MAIGKSGATLIAMLQADSLRQHEMAKAQFEFLKATVGAIPGVDVSKLPAFPEYQVSPEVAAALEAASKSVTEAKAEQDAKRVSEALSPAELAALAASREESKAAKAAEDAIAEEIKAAKAYLDELRDKLEQAIDARKNTKGSLVILKAAERVLGEDYQKYAWSDSGDEKLPAHARVPSTKKPKAAPKDGQPAESNTREQGLFNVEFADGTKLEKVTANQILADAHWASIDTANISNWTTLKTYKGTAFKNWAFKTWSQFPAPRELKTTKGEVVAKIQFLA